MTITRFAPSPTGYLHIGGLRTALFSYLWAKKNNGKFYLRIEDTDKARNSQEATNAILKAFKWLGLEYSGEIIYQSKRDDIYAKYIKQLLDEQKAYKCYMSKEELSELRETQMANNERTKYNGKYRDYDGAVPKNIEPVIRIKSPLSGEIIVRDGVKGDVVFRAEDILDDFVIARADGSPTYNFVVAVDDALMGINEVIRGDDHLSNTPKQMVVYEALGFDLPKFYHVPMIHNSDGKKLSKRDGATDVMEYKEMGYTPEALLNFLVRLGWSFANQEIFSIQEMIKLFNPKNINKSASIYSVDKLDWLSSHYIKSFSNEHLAKLLDEYDFKMPSHDKKKILLDELKKRAKTLKDFLNQAKEILDTPEFYDEKAIKKAFKGDALNILNVFGSKISTAQNLSIIDDYHKIMEETITEMEISFGKIGQALRVALLGRMCGPGLDSVMAIIGKDEVMLRIAKAINFISEAKS